MQVHALLTEPGEISSVFTLLGVFTNGSSSAWSIVNIDLKNAFSKNFLVTPGFPSMILLGLLTYIFIYLFTFVNTLRSLKDTSKAEPVFYSLRDIIIPILFYTDVIRPTWNLNASCLCRRAYLRGHGFFLVEAKVAS